MAVSPKSTRHVGDRSWSADLSCLPVGVLVGAIVFLTPGHPWSIFAFSPEVWGVWSAPLFGVNFTVVYLAAWRAAVLIKRVARDRSKSGRRGDVWDRELDG